jgi:hypothetical protein
MDMLVSNIEDRSEPNVVVVVRDGTVVEILKNAEAFDLVIEVIDLDGDLELDKSEARVTELEESGLYILEGFD